MTSFYKFCSGQFIVILKYICPKKMFKFYATLYKNRVKKYKTQTIS